MKKLLPDGGSFLILFRQQLEASAGNEGKW
jgi:hypothetical protein